MKKGWIQINLAVTRSLEIHQAHQKFLALNMFAQQAPQWAYTQQCTQLPTGMDQSGIVTVGIGVLTETAAGFMPPNGCSGKS